MEKFESKLWSEKALNRNAYVGASLFMRWAPSKWRDLLRDKKASQIFTLLLSFVGVAICLTAFGFSAFFAVSGLHEHQYKLALPFLAVALFTAALCYVAIRDTAKLVIYLFVSKRDITQVLNGQLETKV